MIMLMTKTTISVMRKFAVSQSFLSYLENCRKTNSNRYHFPVDDQEFTYSTLYIAILCTPARVQHRLSFSTQIVR